LTQFTRFLSKCTEEIPTQPPVKALTEMPKEETQARVSNTVCDLKTETPQEEE